MGALSRRTWVAVAAAAALAACATAPKKKPQDELPERRAELRATFDRLYAAYGGSEVAGDPGGGPLGHVVSQADRSYFERECLAAGRGERPVSVSPKLQQFLDRAENRDACRSAAGLQRRIEELEREVAKG